MAAQKSVPVTIPATMAHRNFGELIKRAFSGKEYFIVEKDGLPVVAILSIQEYEALVQTQEQAKQARLKQFREASRAIGEEIEKTGMIEEEIMAKVDKVRQRLYEQNYGAKSAK
ncbi:MAG: type II toxin-antitoxin system Phd/YefM family antitoxin [Anaerolineae bacterium]|nr:type II toxin-antitoxin system Phd/YefM family antitoxin [Anaerolineae bacterium]